MKKNQPYWKNKKLSEMSEQEWEALCDGCGKCCLVKLEDPDTGSIDSTTVSCHLLDINVCRCTNYARRTELVSDCIVLDPNKIKKLRWLPSTCAYRLVSEGKDLKWWHPLVSGDPGTVHDAGISVRTTAISEEDVINIEDYIVDTEQADI